MHSPSSHPTIRQKFADERGELALYIGFTVFIITIAAYGGLILLTRTQNKAVEAIATQIQEKQKEFDPTTVEEFIQLDTRFKNIGILITQHPLASTVLSIIERDTIPQVRFGDFDFTTHLGKVVMKGTAPTYALLARQLIIFEEDAELSSVEFGGLARSDEGIGFDLTLVVKPEVLIKKPLE